MTHLLRELADVPWASGLIVLIVASTLLCSLALVAAWPLRRNPGARAALLTSALLALLACPMILLVMRAAGVVLWTIPVPSRHLELSSSVASRSSDTFVTGQDVSKRDTVPSSGATSTEEAPWASSAASEVTPVAASDSVTQAAPVAVPTPRPVLGRALELTFVVWLFGSLVAAVRFLRSWAALRRLRQSATPLETAAITEVWSQVTRLLNIDRLPPVASSAMVDSPMIAGIVSPTLLLPANLAERLAPQELLAVLLHEAAHILRRDQLVLHLQQLLAVLFWPQPLVHRLNRALIQAREEACDNYALANSSRFSYGETLLRLAQLLPRMRAADGVSRLLHPHWRLEERIAALLDERRSLATRTSIWRVLPVLAAMLLLVVLCGGTAVVAKQASQPTSGVVLKSDSTPPAAVAPSAASTHALGSDTSPERVRALIYLLRQHRIFARCEQWTAAIRELAEIGKPAVPELVAELDRSDRDETLRALGFALRAIGDPRAVPALIRAIPKTLRPPGSDCGILVHDPELLAFLQKNSHFPSNDPQPGYGRPVNEILSALEKITQHREPPTGQDPLRHVFLEGTPAQKAAAREQFTQRQQLWETWWEDHAQEFLTPEELRSVQLPSTSEDLVTQAGEAAFGPLFPTGKEVHLGPVHDVSLDYGQYWDTHSCLDLDTGRVYEFLQGNDGSPGTETDIAWHRKTGVDIRNLGIPEGRDVHLWLVDGKRWDTLEQELQGEQRLELGREAGDSLLSFGERRRDVQRDRSGTFLFTTREGGRGILQVAPAKAPGAPATIRYRRILVGAESDPPAAPETPPQPSRLAWGELHTVRLHQPEVLLTLASDQTRAIPETWAAEKSHFFGQNQSWDQWCRQEEIDLVLERSSSRFSWDGAVPKGPPFRAVLAGRDMSTVRVSSQAFETLTVEHAREILGRLSPEFLNGTMSSNSELAYQPDTFLCLRHEGQVGIVQFSVTQEEPLEVTIRYRMAAATP